jgi:hypothetical protein
MGARSGFGAGPRSWRRAGISWSERSRLGHDFYISPGFEALSVATSRVFSTTIGFRIIRWIERSRGRKVHAGRDDIAFVRESLGTATQKCVKWRAAIPLTKQCPREAGGRRYARGWGSTLRTPLGGDATHAAGGRRYARRWGATLRARLESALRARPGGDPRPSARSERRPGLHFGYRLHPIRSASSATSSIQTSKAGGVVPA